LSKRGRDLFELLALRQGGAPPRRARRSRSNDFEPGPRQPGWLARLWTGLGGRRRGKAKASKRAPPALVSLPGTWLVALLCVALGGGFALGRGTAAAAGSDDLRAEAPTKMRVPGRLVPRAGPSDLDLHQEVETLSPYYLIVLNYPDAQRDAASELAEYLRAHDLKTARLRSEEFKNGDPAWSVVVYLESPAEKDGVVDRIRNVPLPAFDQDGKLAARIAREFKLVDRSRLDPSR
jgi:hypothetical protein